MKTFYYKEKPVIPIAVINRIKLITVPALVDSGADCSVFKSSTAHELGITLNSGEKTDATVGNGEKIIIHLHKVKVVVAGKIIKDAEIGFSEEINTGFDIIGRKSIFDKFMICFDKDKSICFH